MERKQIRFLKTLLFCMITVSSFCVLSVYATDGNTEVPSEIHDTLQTVTNILATIAGFVCVFKLAQIGIMYMLTGANEKSNAKTAILPWIIGAVICGGYLTIGNAVIDMIREHSGSVLDPGDPTQTVSTLGDSALGIIAIIAGAIAVGMLIYIGIRYMLSGAAGMAKVKNTILPWLIGAVIIAGASGITQVVMNLANGSGG